MQDDTVSNMKPNLVWTCKQSELVFLNHARGSGFMYGAANTADPRQSKGGGTLLGALRKGPEYNFQNR